MAAAAPAGAQPARRAPAFPAAMLLDGLPPEEVLLVPPEHSPEEAAVKSPMGLRVSGVLSRLDVDATIALLDAIRGPAGGRPRDGAPALLDGVLRRGALEGRVRVSRAGDGWVLHRVDRTGDPALTFEPQRLRPAMEWFGGFRGDVRDEGADLVRRRVFEMAPPLDESFVPVNGAALRSRFFRGLTPPPPSKRDLGEERMLARLPKDYSPRRPAGLLVWVNAGETGDPPSVFSRALDDLNLIAVGAASSGNDRPIADRLQLALDAVMSASLRFHIDLSRVYVTGISGGGKIATILQACCPDVFAGCVPIVGTGWCEEVPIGNNQAWPRLFGRPDREVQRLWASRRVAPITGPEDFNVEPIRAAVKQMAADGVPTRLYDIPGMGHTLPSADVFREALAWVDEPWRRAQSERERQARERLATVGGAGPRGAPGTLSDEDRATLAQITMDAPWTEEAWEALDRLERHSTSR